LSAALKRGGGEEREENKRLNGEKRVESGGVVVDKGVEGPSLSWPGVGEPLEERRRHKRPPWESKRKKENPGNVGISKRRKEGLAAGSGAERKLNHGVPDLTLSHNNWRYM